jgi:hypothetical protein
MDFKEFSKKFHLGMTSTNSNGLQESEVGILPHLGAERLRFNSFRSS